MSKISARKSYLVSETDRSPSVKRVREGEGEGEWREVVPCKNNKIKSKPKVVAGTANISEFADLVGPEQCWIGNTHPTTDIDKVKQVLERCVQSLDVTETVGEL